MQLKQNKSLEHTCQYGKCGLILPEHSQLGRTLHSLSKQENMFHIASAAWFTIWYFTATSSIKSHPDIYHAHSFISLNQSTLQTIQTVLEASLCLHGWQKADNCFEILYKTWSQCRLLYHKEKPCPSGLTLIKQRFKCPLQCILTFLWYLECLSRFLTM